MDKIRFGTAGIPFSTKIPNTINGIERIRELKLDAFEIEFVRSVNIKSEETAALIRKTAKKNDVVMSCHGQYYVNLNSLEDKKIEASKERIYHAAKVASMCGAFSATWHMGFYMKQDPKKVYTRIKRELKSVVKRLDNDGIKIDVRPETTGKKTQWGNLKEILKLSQEIERVKPCIDFGHMHARYNGANNTYDEFCEILQDVKEALGRRELNNMHIQVCGIEYSEKGERRHLPFKGSDCNLKDMCKAFKKYKIKGSVIVESLLMEQDVLYMKKIYNSVRWKGIKGVNIIVGW